MTSKTNQLFDFICERHNIHERRASGESKPWTDDAILQSYRFCNVYRERDTVTKWVAANWRRPNSGERHLWFAMAVARFINWPDTLAEIGFPLPWEPALVLAVLQEREQRGDKVWTGAYTIGTQGHSMPKPQFIVEHVLGALWQQRKQLAPRQGDTLHSFAQRLLKVPNQGQFMVGQLIADLKYDTRCPLFEAPDWWTWAASGPGSRRGLNRVLGYPKDQRWNEAEWLRQLTRMRTKLKSLLKAAGMPNLHAQDCQNCLCEWDKYERVRLGEGKPRARYKGAA